jgi:hypothetical protein
MLVTGCDRAQPSARTAFMESNAGVSISLDLGPLGGIVPAPAIRWDYTQNERNSVSCNFGRLPNVYVFDLNYSRSNIHHRKAKIPHSVFLYEDSGLRNGYCKSCLQKLWQPLNLGRTMPARKRTMT